MGINRSLAKLAGRCEHPDQVVMHDWWLALVAARFGKMLYIDQSTMDYRQHGNNSVGAKDVGSVAYLFDKLAHPAHFQKAVVEKKRQAAAFAQCYAPELTREEHELLLDFARERSLVAFKLRYLRWINSFPRKIGFLIRW